MRYTRLVRKWMAYLVVVALVGGMWPGIILGPGRAEGSEFSINPEFMPVNGLTVGVIQGQMVRLSVQNLSLTETVQVAFALVNFQGSAVGPMYNPISLPPGKGTFVDIPGKDILGNDTRAEVTGFVRVFASQKALKAGKALWMAASLQVLDETTHGTLLVLPFANIAGSVHPEL